MEPEKSPQDDIWRAIPPEEKLQLMSRAQATGCLAAVMAAVVSAPIAIALQIPWIFWGTLLGIPFIFQFAAGRSWRGIRPRVMLEYLAARSAARRYAFANKSKDLKLELIFRGKVERIFEEGDSMSALEAAVEDSAEAQVWIALFTDALVLMSEKAGGATLQFAGPINDRLGVRPETTEGEPEYRGLRAVEISTAKRNSSRRDRFRITSPYQAALVVFERKLDSYVKAATVAAEERAQLLESAPGGGILGD